MASLSTTAWRRAVGSKAKPTGRKKLATNSSLQNRLSRLAIPRVIVAPKSAAIAAKKATTRRRGNRLLLAEDESQNQDPGLSSMAPPHGAKQAVINTSVPHANALMPAAPIGNGSFPDHTVGANAETRWPLMFRPHEALLTRLSA